MVEETAISASQILIFKNNQPAFFTTVALVLLFVEKNFGVVKGLLGHRFGKCNLRGKFMFPEVEFVW